MEDFVTEPVGSELSYRDSRRRLCFKRSKILNASQCGRWILRTLSHSSPAQARGPDRAL